MGRRACRARLRPARIASVTARAAALAGLILQGACAARAAPALPAPRGLSFLIDSIIDAPPYDRTHWGIAVRDLASGEVLFARNADRHFIPASNTKLVVTTVAMGELGPDWRFTTDVFAIGDGASPDALVVRGAGDPTFSERFAESDLAALDSLAFRVFAAGVRTVTGDLVIDASRFPGTAVLPMWEVGDLPWYYAAPTSAFAIGEATFQVVRRPGSAPGLPATIEVLGGGRTQPLVARVTTDTAGAPTRWTVDWLDRRDTVFVSGSLAVSSPVDTVRLAVADPEAHAGRAFVLALERVGVRVLGRVTVMRDSAHIAAITGNRATRLVASRVSPPLADVVAAILKPSQNWIADQLLRTLGYERGEGGTWAAALDVERRYLIDRIGIDSLAFNLRDGSGLTAQNLLTPNAILDMLIHAHDEAWGADYAAALPSPGEDGGTLSARLPGYESRFRAKTGTIANVNSLSGYLHTEDGRHLALSIMSNGSGLPSARVRAAIDAIVRAIDTTRSTP